MANLNFNSTDPEHIKARQNVVPPSDEEMEYIADIIEGSFQGTDWFEEKHISIIKRLFNHYQNLQHLYTVTGGWEGLTSLKAAAIPKGGITIQNSGEFEPPKIKTMNNTTTTNGQKPVYNGIGFAPEPPKDRIISELIPPKIPEDRTEIIPSSKWLIPIFYVAVIALFALFVYWVYEQGKQDGITQEQTKQAYDAKQSEINAITAEKKQDGITEREKSKISAERAKIIRDGVIRELPVIKDTTRDYKHKYLKELAR